MVGRDTRSPGGGARKKGLERDCSWCFVRAACVCVFQLRQNLFLACTSTLASAGALAVMARWRDAWGLGESQE